MALILQYFPALNFFYWLNLLLVNEMYTVIELRALQCHITQNLLHNTPFSTYFSISYTQGYIIFPCRKLTIFLIIGSPPP